jgi:hypothetical protein
MLLLVPGVEIIIATNDIITIKNFEWTLKPNEPVYNADTIHLADRAILAFAHE